MTAYLRLIAALGAGLVLSMLVSFEAAAQLCNSDRDCSRARPLCILGGCQRACRTNADCGAGFVCAGQTRRRFCQQAPASSPSPGIPVPGEGGRCGAINLGGVIKHIACKPGLFCNKSGRCQRPRA